MCFHAYVIDILKQCVWKKQNCVIMTWAQVDLRHCYDDLQLDLQDPTWTWKLKTCDSDDLSAFIICFQFSVLLVWPSLIQLFTLKVMGREYFWFRSVWLRTLLDTTYDLTCSRKNSFGLAWDMDQMAWVTYLQTHVIINNCIISCLHTGYIQASRALMIAAIVFGTFGLVATLVGMKCSKIGGENYILKGRIAAIGGVFFLLQGKDLRTDVMAM